MLQKLYNVSKRFKSDKNVTESYKKLQKDAKSYQKAVNVANGNKTENTKILRQCQNSSKMKNCVKSGLVCVYNMGLKYYVTPVKHKTEN